MNGSSESLSLIVVARFSYRIGHAAGTIFGLNEAALVQRAGQQLSIVKSLSNQDEYKVKRGDEIVFMGNGREVFDWMREKWEGA